MHVPVQRLLPALVLVLWAAPGMGALGVALHLALDHHGSHGGEHGREISDVARTATHGHHHDTATGPDHDHEARIDGFAPALRPGSSPVAVLPSPVAVRAPLAEPARPARAPRRAPPDPLFTTHCSLLL